MPPLRSFWATLPRYVVPAALSAYATLAGLNLIIGIDFWLYTIAGAAVGGLGWYLAARDHLDNEKSRQTLDGIHRHLGELIPGSVTNLSGLSNSALRIRVSETSARLRALARRINSERIPHFRAAFRNHEDWQADTERLMRESQHNQELYRAELHPLATSLHQEIHRRLTDSEWQPIMRTGEPALDFGMLAGRDPLGDAATFLENEVRRLPNDGIGIG